MAKKTQQQPTEPTTTTEYRYVMVAPTGALLHDGLTIEHGSNLAITDAEAVALVEAGLIVREAVPVAAAASQSGGENGNEGSKEGSKEGSGEGSGEGSTESENK